MLQSAIASGAEYLFHNDHPEKMYDSGDQSLQCGRRADVIKLWLSWKRYGTSGFRSRVEKAIRLASYCADLILGTNGALLLLTHPTSFNVCFWYVPRALRASAHSITVSDAAQNGDHAECKLRVALERRDKVLMEPRMVAKIDAALCPSTDAQPCHTCRTLDQFTRNMYRAMQMEGFMLVNYSSLPERNLPSFFRLILNNPQVQPSDLQALIANILQLGEKAEKSTNRI